MKQSVCVVKDSQIKQNLQLATTDSRSPDVGPSSVMGWHYARQPLDQPETSPMTPPVSSKCKMCLQIVKLR